MVRESVMDTDKVVREEDIRCVFPNLRSVEVQGSSGQFRAPAFCVKGSLELMPEDA
jgi:hypothetical protein